MAHSNNLCQIHFVFSISSLLIKFTHLETTLQISIMCGCQPHTYAKMQLCNSPVQVPQVQHCYYQNPSLKAIIFYPEPISFLLFGITPPQWAKTSSFMKFLAQTMTHSRVPPNEWQARLRDLSLTTNSNQPVSETSPWRHTVISPSQRPLPDDKQ